MQPEQQPGLDDIAEQLNEGKFDTDNLMRSQSDDDVPSGSESDGLDGLGY